MRLLRLYLGLLKSDASKQVQVYDPGVPEYYRKKYQDGQQGDPDIYKDVRIIEEKEQYKANNDENRYRECVADIHGPGIESGFRLEIQAAMAAFFIHFMEILQIVPSISEHMPLPAPRAPFLKDGI